MTRYEVENQILTSPMEKPLQAKSRTITNSQLLTKPL